MPPYLAFVLIACHVFSLGAANDFCEDRSVNFENGTMKCVSHYEHYNNIRYKCTISCHPGFIAKPGTQINCHSNGNRVWKVDSQGNRAQVYYGSWSPDITTANCEGLLYISGHNWMLPSPLAPTSCQGISNGDKPLHGDVVCTTHNQTKTCVRNCAYPYEVSEPAFRKEHCGPDTNFFWSHVLRNNVTKMPACVAPQTCRALRDSDTPDHGQMVCTKEEWADTVICELRCEKGYIPKATSKPFEFCGPTTAFIWSHVHAARKSSAQIGGCEQSPVSAEIIVRVNASCENISTQKKEQGAEKLLEVLNSTLENLSVHDIRLGVSLLSWRTHCNSHIIQEEVEVDDTTFGLWSDYIDEETADSLNGTEEITKIEKVESSIVAPIKEVETSTVPLPKPTIVLCTEETPESVKSEINQTMNDTEIRQRENESRATTPPSKQSGATMPTANEPDRNVIIVRTLVSDLVFAFHYKVNCASGRCKEACSVLPLLSEDNRCQELCRTKASPTVNQVRHLTTAYVDRIIESVDVSTVQDIIHGAEFKLLNVTSKVLEEYVPTENDVNQIKAPNSRYYSSSDEC